VIRIDSPYAPLAQLEGARIVVLNWRDVQHPQAGGAEQYMHQIARRWVAGGARGHNYLTTPQGVIMRASNTA